MNFENGGQLGKLQQLADEIAGSSQLDRALARLRRQRNRYECSEASGVDHFYAAEVDHDSTGLTRPSWCRNSVYCLPVTPTYEAICQLLGVWALWATCQPDRPAPGHRGNALGAPDVT